MPDKPCEVNVEEIGFILKIITKTEKGLNKHENHTEY